jgi:hypothetical protein
MAPVLTLIRGGRCEAPPNPAEDAERYLRRRLTELPEGSVPWVIISLVLQVAGGEA